MALVCVYVGGGGGAHSIMGWVWRVCVCVETVLWLELLPSEPYLDGAGPDGVKNGHPAGYKCFPRRSGLTCVPLK